MRTRILEKDWNSHLAELSDAELLDKWKDQQEPEAVEVLVRRHAFKLVRFVSSRMRARFPLEDGEDIVQSAFGSFFAAIGESRLELSATSSIQALLLTFTRRKLARAIERRLAAKRGGDAKQIPLSGVAEEGFIESTAQDLRRALREVLDKDELLVCELLAAGHTQQDVAEQLGISDRTVRRRIESIRNKLQEGIPPGSMKNTLTTQVQFASNDLPEIHYREFVLGKMFATGGFAKVYRATTQDSGQQIAVKFLKKSLWQSGRARESFLKEIEQASKIRHPGVSRYLGWGTSPHGGPYVVSEWIDGETLASICRKRKAKGVEVIGWLRQIWDILNAVHAIEIVHGDITPNNLLLTHRGKVVLTDFGMSRTISNTSQTNHAMGGTLGFSAPEQLDDAFGEVGFAADVYSLGAIAAWLLDQWDWLVLENNSNETRKAYLQLSLIASRCVCEMPSERPSLQELQPLLG